MRTFVTVTLLVLCASGLNAATIHVPANQPTIQAGIDAAVDGDTVLVAPGLYEGSGNRGITFGGKGISLVGDGGPDSCEIYCPNQYHAFRFLNGEDSTTVVSGFKVTGDFEDYNSSPRTGGAVYCEASAPTILNCVFEGHFASQNGGAVYIEGGSPIFLHCYFLNNKAKYYGSVSGIAYGGAVSCNAGSTPRFEYCVFEGNQGAAGGAIACLDSDPTIINCTMVDNQAYYGAHVYCTSSAPIIEACIMGFSRSGAAVYCEDEESDPQVSCCNFYGNAYGDWEGCLESQLQENGNTHSNPLFCDAGNGDYNLLSTSGCLPENHECGILVGAFGAGCTPEFRVWNVQSDGSGEAVTIQDAIDSCVHGDTVLIHAGVYTGDGNRGLDLGGKLITLIGADGPENTVIDCGGQGRGFYLRLGEDSTTQIRGLTIRNGFGRGAGALCYNASPLFANCWFMDNDATGYPGTISFGGGVALIHSSARFENCIIANNVCGYGQGSKNGGGLYIYMSMVEMVNCTVHGNIGGTGGAIDVSKSKLILRNCIVSENYTFNGYPPFWCHQSDVQLFCCDVFGNQNGDWVECLDGMNGVNGNFSADPLFCDAESDDYRLDGSSPCRPENNGCGIQIGALGGGCTPTDVGDERALGPLPREFSIKQNYPNPFNPATTIEYDLPSRSHVIIDVYDINGRHVLLLLDQSQSGGRHSVTWSGMDSRGNSVATGVYFYHLRAGDFSESRKMILLR